MPFVHYISHADVRVEPDIPVPRWSLSDVGRARTQRLLSQPWVASLTRIVSSPETKALETATMLADHLDLAVEVRPMTGEIDRSRTGYVTHDRHEELADQLFRDPYESAAGWERAVDAQDRIVTALADLLGPGVAGDVAVVGHGGVGTLWWCWLAEEAIDRRHDQSGSGCWFTVDAATRRVLHAWRPIDEP